MPEEVELVAKLIKQRALDFEQPLDRLQIALALLLLKPVKLGDKGDRVLVSAGR